MKLLKSSIYFVLLLLILFNPDSIHAERAQTYEVNSPVLNVRSEAALNAEVIGFLTKGNKLEGFQEKYGWVQTYYKGKEAWVAEHHLIPLTNHSQKESNPVETSSSDTVTITESINVRSGPGTNYSIIGSAYPGESYEVMNADKDWYQISYNNGSSGWIASWLTSESLHSENSTADRQKGSEEGQQTIAHGSLSGATIVLDPGHGGYDSGAIGLNGTYEKSMTSITADYLADELHNAGANVIVTRSGDYFVSLEERARISNSYPTDAFISLHYNAFPIISAQGISTYYISQTGKALAKPVQTALTSSTNLYNRGIVQENFHVLRNTTAPAILIELGFITNPYDLSVVQNSSHQNTVAKAITNGLIQYFSN
ncbi:N-acetylmuramoyl-L-alanine amidase [Oceanobacillus bengalensis]|uniref:N-acetylmuramoyl-L-alanine amidase n=1 Tax=Oceanobacillus bengalensis TaxID=1435466 RepID=A0A494YZZ7_9BACI|nr:N-acetylmuramoyl-L-alanine amidase [Oceanobacillus bengalensis]RKQ15834.1 N-acetylmuramoyl-L-alanine amidase [Oceanobacillus bengalensis]